MSLGAPKVNPPAPTPPPAAQGADALQLGDANDPSLRTGNIGRLALRIGQQTKQA